VTAVVTYDEVSVGDELPPIRVRLQRVNLVMYAGASGDFNPIHWNERIATAVGLPNVIAHGMLTMATAGRVVTEWAGDPGAVESYTVRFAKPVPVPDDDRGAPVQVTARVTEKLPGHHVRVEITATIAGDDGEPAEVLKQAHALVRLA
jgi:acyl dehydratase